MKIDRAGLPLVLGALAPATALVLLKRPGWAAACGALGGFFAYFFRDPDRDPPSDPTAIVAPADGRVMIAGTARDEGPPGQWLQVAIFLSPLDVHINRAPVSGRVTRVEYRPGSFLPAYHRQACENERTEIWIDREGVPVVARQIVGVLARRIVCRVRPGDQVATGDRIGLMKFGSRMDVFVPHNAAALRVKVGDHVRGGETIIANLA